MEKSTWLLREREQTRVALTAAYHRAMGAVADGKRAVLELRPERRSDVQNKLLHAMFSDIARHASFSGRKLTPAQVKTLFIGSHTIATGGEADLIAGLEGGLVNIRESSASMSVARMASLIEYAQCWMANNDMEVNG